MIGSSGNLSSDLRSRYRIELCQRDKVLSEEYTSDYYTAHNAIMSSLEHPSMEGSPELYYRLYDTFEKKYIEYSKYQEA